VEPPAICQTGTPLVLTKEQVFHTWRRSNFTSFFLFSFSLFLLLVVFFVQKYFYNPLLLFISECHENILGKNKCTKRLHLIAYAFSFLLQKHAHLRGDLLFRIDMLRSLGRFLWNTLSLSLGNMLEAFANIAIPIKFPRSPVEFGSIEGWSSLIVPGVKTIVGFRYIASLPPLAVHEHLRRSFLRIMDCFFPSNMLK